ncbi:MAG: TetR/AcrR family transcriptional regulator [Actinomycetes bacterium]
MVSPSDSVEPDGAGKVTATGGGRQSRKRDKTRAELIRSAQEVLAEEGPDASVQTITDRADVGLGTLYYHFTDKSELFKIAAREALMATEAYMGQHMAGIEDPGDLFATAIRLFLRTPDTHPLYARLVVKNYPNMLEARAAYSPLAMNHVRAAIANGTFECSDPELVLLMYSGALFAMLATRLGDPEIGPERCDAFAEIALGMFGASSENARRWAHRPLQQST